MATSDLGSAAFLDLLIHFDSLKMNFENGEAYPDDGEDLEDEELVEWDGFSRGDLAEAMVDMFEADDPSDLDWLPEKLKNKRGCAMEAKTRSLDTSNLSRCRWAKKKTDAEI